MLPTIEELIEYRIFTSKAKKQLRQLLVKFERTNPPPQPLLSELIELHGKEKNTDYKNKMYLLIEILKERKRDDDDIDLTYMPGMFDTSITLRGEENKDKYYY